MNDARFSLSRFARHGGALLLLLPVCCSSITLARAPQITLEQGTPPRTQNQQGLPPDKKKSLSRLGPDEVFPTRDPNDTPEKANRPPAAPKPRTAAKPSPIAASTPRPAPSAEPTATPLRIESVVGATIAPTIAPTVAPAVMTGQVSALPSAPPAEPAGWQFPVVLGATCAVFVAFVGVLFRLRRKLREDRGA